MRARYGVTIFVAAVALASGCSANGGGAATVTTVRGASTTTTSQVSAATTAAAPTTTTSATPVRGTTSVPSTPASTVAATTLAPATTAAPAPTTTVAPCRRRDEHLSTIKRGDCGQAVRELQDILSRIGIDVAVDGLFGAGTEAGVREFQTGTGLTADGVVGEQTWAMLITFAEEL